MSIFGKLPHLLSRPPQPRENIMKCTYCGGTSFFEGPSGGMSTNVLCANPSCRHWFNATPGLGLLDDLHRVEPTDEEKLAAQSDSKKKADQEAVNRRIEGIEAYRQGLTAQVLRQEEPYGYAEAKHTIDRLFGFIDAMAEDVRRQVKAQTVQRGG